MLEFLEEAHRQAASALAATRAFNLDQSGRHDRSCSEQVPCRDCTLDAYSATVAIVLAFEVHMADAMHEALSAN